VIHGVIQTPSGGKFYNTLSLTGGMCVGVGNLSGGTEIILQILPRCTRRQIFHDQSVVGSGSRWVATGTASISSSKSAAAATTTTASAAITWVTGKFNTNSASLHILSIKIMGGIIGIAQICVFLNVGSSRPGEAARARKPPKVGRIFIRIKEISCPPLSIYANPSSSPRSRLASKRMWFIQ